MADKNCTTVLLMIWPFRWYAGGGHSLKGQRSLLQPLIKRFSKMASFFFLRFFSKPVFSYYFPPCINFVMGSSWDQKIMTIEVNAHDCGSLTPHEFNITLMGDLSGFSEISHIDRVRWSKNTRKNLGLFIIWLPRYGHLNIAVYSDSLTHVVVLKQK